MTRTPIPAAAAALATLLLSGSPITLAASEPAIVIVSPEVTRSYPVKPKPVEKDDQADRKVGDDEPGGKASGTTAVDGETPPGSKAKTQVAKPEKALPVPPMSERERKEAEHCLALNIYHEARSEPSKGQEAVAAVTINRVASAAFPDSVCQVVKQGGKKRNGCQFSWWCDRNSDHPREHGAWEEALYLSRKALDGKVSDPTNGALYYHANYVKPRWARTFKRTNKIGRHLFYKPRGA